MSENLRLTRKEIEQVKRAIWKLEGISEDDSEDEEKSGKRSREEEEYL